MPHVSDAELVLHYAPQTRSFTALWLLEELGVDYQIAPVDLKAGEHKRPEYLQKNPMGKVPTVMDHGQPVSELGAIAIYLADRYADARLAPGLLEPERPAYLRWMLFSGGVMEPCLGEKFFKWEVPASSVAWGCFADMERTLTEGLRPGPYLLGDRFSAADVIVGSTARFGVMFGAMEKTGVIADYVTRLSERPACLRAAAIEAEHAPKK